MKNKKILSFILMLIIITTFSTTVFASGTQIDLSKHSCNPGEEVTVELTMPQNSGVVCIQLELDFADALILKNVADGGIMGKYNHSDIYESPYILSWENDTLRENITETGILAILNFKVSEDAKAGEYPVKIVRAEVLDKDINDVGFKITDGIITVLKNEEVSDESNNNNSNSGNNNSGNNGGSNGGGGGGAAVKPPVKEEKPKTEVTVEPEKEEKTETTVAFDDVNANDWFFEYVISLAEKGIVSGDGNGKFAPNDNVTREQFLKMLLESVNAEFDNAQNSFADVDENGWYKSYVLTAKNLGIVTGVSDTRFGIGENITRQDMAVMISRTIEKFDIDVSFADVDAFDDSDVISDYAKKSVNAMKSIGLIEGYNNKFRPLDNLTRAEAAKVISELIDIDK